MAQIKIFGYCDRLSVKPGETLNVYVSADGVEQAEAKLVRVIHGDEHPDGPGYIAEPVSFPDQGTWAVKKQYTQVGSFLTVADAERRLALDGDITLFAFVRPTLPEIGVRQALLGRWDNYRNTGYCLGLDGTGHLEFWVGDGNEVDYFAAEAPLISHQWYFVAATYERRTGKATLYREGVGTRYSNLLGKVAPFDFRSHVEETLRFAPLNEPDTPFLIAGSRDWHQTRGHFVGQGYCGKIDRPGVFSRALSRAELDRIRMGGEPPQDGRVAYWNTASGYSDDGIGDTVIDEGPFGLHAEGYNKPIRGQTGWNWNGKNDCFRLAPEEYGGVEFHVDAMIDCNWELTRTISLPDDLKSGVYALEITAGDGSGLSTDQVVFFVRPKTPKGKIALLIPTASYLAYANEHLAFDAQILQSMTGQPPMISEIDIEMYKNAEFGLSTYDSFMDGLGVCYSSYRRPIMNMRPRYRIAGMATTWQFPADLSIVGWLEAMGYEWDCITDEDLHREGTDCLKPYNVVITGTHPEYVSERMLDAWEDYVASGGRLVYMGGNGFYWCVGFPENQPWIMEVRKLDSGMRAWQAMPGEHYLASTGEKSGLWRNRARAPQKLTGVGFIAEGFEHSQPYRRMPDSWHRTVSWITEGIEGEIIGDFGLAHGGAAGVELDRYDLKLGTPPHAKIIASSGGHTDNYVLVTEELLYAYQGTTGSQDYRIRGDIVFFTAPNDGGVFSTGSIAFGQALPVNNFQNDVSRLLRNVVDAFAKPGTLPGGAWISDEKQWR